MNDERTEDPSASGAAPTGGAGDDRDARIDAWVRALRDDARASPVGDRVERALAGPPNRGSPRPRWGGRALRAAAILLAAAAAAARVAAVFSVFSAR